MRVRRLVGLGVVLTAAACGAQSESSPSTAPSTTVPASTTAAVTTTTAEPGFEVVSEDGDLTVWVPVSAAATDPGITVRLLTPDEFPPELAAAADDPEVRIYNLEPDGLVFDAPVTVTRRLDAVRFEDLAPNEVPVMVILTRNPDGAYELYSDLAVRRDGADVFVSGTTTHFSPAIVIRESPTLSVTLSREQIENVASARSFEHVATLLNETPGVIPVTAALRDREGASLAGSGMIGTIDGVVTTSSGSGLDIHCDDVKTIEVLPITYTTEFGSSPAAGQAGFTTVTSLNLFPPTTRMVLTLDARLRCHDPATSILKVNVTGFEVATDHPGGKEWIIGGDFRGGLSGAYVRMGDIPRLEGVWGGLICDNDRNGSIDPTDTMFPAYPAEEVGGVYSYVAPLFDYGRYFIYLVDGPQYSGVPAGSEWTVSAGLSAFGEKYTGTGRFEASIGFLGVGGAPFVYDVGPSEEAQPAPGAKIEMFDLLRIQF